MNNSALIKLYFLLIHADGEVSEREKTFGLKMVKTENMNETDFQREIELLKKRSASVIFDESIEELKRLNRTQQVRCMAWLCLCANADGFMDKTEWQLIYKVYHTILGLNQDEIMKAQKELNQLLAAKSLSMIGVL